MEAEKKQVYEPPAMTDVRDKYGQLKAVLGAFNDKVSDVLSKAEVQFLQAYRAHMQGVHKEKQELESKLKAAEDERANDKQIQALEKDRDWYMAQEQQLASFVAAMEQDLHALKHKFNDVMKERDQLALQLKAEKRQFRILRADVHSRRAHDTVSFADPTIPTQQDAHHQPGQRIPHSQSAIALHRPGEADDLRAHQRSLPLLRPHDGHLQSMSLLERESQAEEQEQWELEQETAELREQVAKAKAEAQRLRSMLVEDKARQSDLEEFFLQGVEDIKREAERLKRKTRMVPGQSQTIDVQQKEYEASLGLVFDSLFPEKQIGRR